MSERRGDEEGNAGAVRPWRSEAGRTSVLAEDVELAAAVREDRREEATRVSVAAVVRVPTGTWDATADAHLTTAGHGLIMLDGVLVRRVGFGRRIGAELLGPGDLVRPLDHDGEGATLPFEATWRVVTPLRLALLDRRWSYRMAAYPDVGVALTARAMRRSRRLANTLAIAQHPRLDARLHLLLWELADRHGRVGAGGVRLDLPLTHDLLAQLAAAQRPSVSSALARLAEAGLVERTLSSWLLHGDPPDRLTWERQGRGDET